MLEIEALSEDVCPPLRTQNICQLVPKHLNVLCQLDLPPLCYFYSSLSSPAQTTSHGPISIFTIKLNESPPFHSSTIAALLQQDWFPVGRLYKDLDIAYFATVEAFV